MTSSPADKLAETIAQTETPEFRALMLSVSPLLPNRPTYQDYAQGLRANYRHIETHHPELFAGGLHVLDVGPGIGCFMLLAQAFGNTVWGEDRGLRGDKGTTKAYAKLVRHLKLNVRYRGFHHYIEGEAMDILPGSLDLIHFRGSLDAVLSRYRDQLAQVVPKMVNVLHGYLKPGGKVYIHHNQGELSDKILVVLRQAPQPLRLVEVHPYISMLEG